MLYISGPNDTLKDLKERDEFSGTLPEYERLFALLNPELCQQYPDYKQKLPAFMPMVLATHSPFDPTTRPEVVKELFRFTLDERKTLRMMQDNHYDIPLQLSMTDIMEDLQLYAAGLRKWLKAPLIATPWTDFNSSLTDKSLFKLLSESSKYSSSFIQGSSRFNAVDQLYQDMMTRDVLNRRLHLLQNQKGSEAIVLRRDLENQIKDLTAKIKQALPKKLSATMTKYVNRRFTHDEMRKMRANSFSAKGARTGKPVTTNLDVLNRSGLARLRLMIKGLKKLGTGVAKGATMLNYGVVAYDAAEAYRDKGNKAAVRTFLTGASAVYLTAQAVTAMGGTSALGGLVIGTLAGDAALGATLLICSPIVGWVIVVVTGVAVAGYIGYKSKSLLEGVWDIGEDVGGYIYKEATKAAGFVHDEIVSAWSSSNQWFLELYESKN